MNLPHELEKLRDKLAFKTFKELCPHVPDHVVFLAHGNKSQTMEAVKIGFSACFRALSEAAGEFDEKAVQEYYESDGDEIGYMECARWQFEQDRARIGGAIIEGRRMAAEAISSRELALMDRLAELQVKYDERGMAMRETGDMVRSLYEPKLAECEKQKRKYWQLIVEHQKQAEELQQLEAKRLADQREREERSDEMQREHGND